MRPNVEILQAKVKDWLTDVGRVYYQDGTVRDPETGLDVPNYVDRYVGPLLVQPQSNYKRAEVGGAVITISKYEITLPADALAEVDDLIEITTCMFDAMLAEKTLRVEGVALDTWQVARYCVASIP